MVEAPPNENHSQEENETPFDQWRAQWRDGEGEPPSAFLARHPEFRSEVDAYLVAQEGFRILGAGLPPESPSPLESGQTLEERYELLEEIGRGGMGVVWLARDRRLNRLVAIKRLHSALADPAQSNTRFVQEGQVIAQLRHPGIVTVHDWVLEPARGGPYLVMEYIQGSTLDQLLLALEGRQLDKLTKEDLQAVVVRPIKYFSESVRSAEDLKRLWTGSYAGFCCRAVAEIAEALDHAHQKGFIHRDVKPSNILLGLDGRPRLLDFGLARLTEGKTLTISAQLLGTPAYMAPEQVNRRWGVVGFHTDVYGLGLTLYELVTLQRAFRGESPAEILEQIISKDPVPPRRLQPTLHRDLEAIILKAIEKEPARRYRSAAAFAEDLSCFLEYKPVTAKPIGSIGRLFRRIRRHPWVSLLLALLLLTMTSLVWFATSFRPYHLSVEANRLWDQGDLEGARRLFLDVIWYRPHDANAFTSLGILSDQLGETEAAERYLGKALKIDPTNTSALTTLAGMREDQERLDDAVALYRQALRVSPSDTYTWSNLGDALALRNWSSKSEMIGYLRDRGFLVEEMPELLYYLGLAYARQQKVRQACDVWLHIRTLTISGWSMRLSLARALDKHACEAIQR